MSDYYFPDSGQGRLDQALVDKNLPVFLTRHGPAIWPVTDPAAGPPVIILSVPKSGSFFTEALYRRMGYQGVFVHAMESFCNDWRFEECSGLKNIPATALLPLVLPGQIIVSHCGRSPAIEAALSGFRKIYLYRDLREVLVSHTREVHRLDTPPGETPARVAGFCRDRGDDLRAVIEAVSAWRNADDVLAIDFAELTSPDPSRQEALAARFTVLMGWDAAKVIAALRAVPGDDTRTKSVGPHATTAECWDDQCEAWFCEHLGSLQVVPDRFL